MKNKNTGNDRNTPRVIKKYPNRRLYDTHASTYITLVEIKALVMGGRHFVVRDAKTAEDLTRSILLQILLEEEAGGSPMFTTEVLAHIIRFYGQAMQGFMGDYLEKNIQTLREMQTRMAEQSQAMTPELWARFMAMQPPLMRGIMTNNLEQSRDLFVQMQEEMQMQTQKVLESFALKH